jgi:hypothetical protein
LTYPHRGNPPAVKWGGSEKRLALPAEKADAPEVFVAKLRPAEVLVGHRKTAACEPLPRLRY